MELDSNAVLCLHEIADNFVSNKNLKIAYDRWIGENGGAHELKRSIPDLKDIKDEFVRLLQLSKKETKARTSSERGMRLPSRREAIKRLLTHPALRGYVEAACEEEEEDEVA